ncbi:MAG: asparagine synthase (glutamine-hydrolyzing) [Flavobacteriales bacterium]
MCGIAGIYYFKKSAVTENQIRHSLNALGKRGPDNNGFFHNECVLLGHTRLSIIDVSSKANQPFTDSSGNYTLIFNGEIFNYKELKAELQPKYTFRTDSDTEVLLHWLMEYGEEGISKLNGFFVFAFYSHAEKSVLLARDQFGIKPLVYCNTESQFIFSSEIKGLLPFLNEKRIDKAALQLYFELSYLPAPYTILQGVSKLEPGHYIKVVENSFKKASYYVLSKVSGEDVLTGNAEEIIRKKLELSVSRRLVADVPVATFLSGGIDSALVTALAVKHHPNISSFSIGFKENTFFDESSFAEQTAKHLGTNHHTFRLSSADLFKHFHEALDYLDEPFADSSALNLYVLCKEVSGKVKVALSGDGADELFGGYNKHQAHARAIEKTISNKIIKSVLPFINQNSGSRNSKYSNRLRQAAKYASGLKLTTDERYRRWASWGRPEKVKSLIVESFSTDVDLIWKNLYRTPHGNELDDLLYNDMRIVLEGDMLRKVDSMSMANSLEVRPPFLDVELVNYVMTLPANMRYHKRNNKALLKTAFKNLLPEEVFNRPKKGFEVPLASFLQSDFKSQVDILLAKERIESQGLFYYSTVQKIKDEAFRTQNAEDIYLLWAMICFQWWVQEYLN